jgi:plasmid replication initiation protein
MKFQLLLNMSDSKKEQNRVAVQHNDLIFGQQAFTLLQKRLFLLAVAQIKREDKELQSYHVKVNDLIQSGTSEDIYNRIKTIATGLRKIGFMRRYVEDGKRVFEDTSMIEKCKHKEGEGVVEIVFTSSMKKLLIQLKGNFTMVSVVNQRACKTVYGQRMYEMLYSWRSQNKMEISMKELRIALNIENKYKNFTNFRNRVLKPAQSDLKKHTNIQFTWEELKKEKGKKITHILFHFVVDDNPPPPKLDGTKSDQINLPYKLSERLKNTIGLHPKDQKKIERWLEGKPDQQKAMANWIYNKIEVPDPPVDSTGFEVRDITAWALDKIKKAIDKGGFPSSGVGTPASLPKPAITDEMETADGTNPFQDFRDRIGSKG